MKIQYALFVGMLAWTSPGWLCAQNGFDVKKKHSESANTSSLHARQIRGQASGRQSAHAFTQGRSFLQPVTQEHPHKIFFSAETALPSFIETTRDLSSGRTGARADARSGSYAYLQELATVLRVKDPQQEFVIQRTQHDALNKMHVRMTQMYKNVPVYGSEIVVHLNEFGEGEALNGKYLRLDQDIDTQPAVASATAIQTVKSHLRKGSPERPLTALERQLIQFDEPQTTLCIYEDKGLVKSNVLAYHVVYCPSVHARWEYFVDAHTGNILHTFNSTCYVDGPRTASAKDLNNVTRTINTYQVGANYFLLDASRAMYKPGQSKLPDEPAGGILTIDMNNTFGNNATIQHVVSASNTWNNASSVSAHFNGGTAYEYFRTTFGRNSIDGSGGSILSVINVTDENGGALDNAYWNGKAMFYGNGKTGFKPLAGGLDVAGHEMTHGVVQNTANLEYQGESGAINESMADVFGSMLDPGDWLIGEDVVKTAVFPSGALRSLSDPHNGGSSLNDNGYQPRHTNEAYRGAEDNGGVHINSGIPNFAFFKLASATTRDKAAAIFYRALDDYLTKSSKFIDLRLAVVKAAGDLFGASSNEATQAGLAFDAVGIVNGQGGDYTETLPTNPGTEFLLIYNTDAGDINSLYRSTPDAANFAPLTKTSFKSRPSVTDDGSAAVFVAADKTIHAIETSPNDDATEFVLQQETIWSNVVISKDGNRLAAVTDAQDNTIYVYDFESEKWGQFELYNPTYSENVTSGGTVYADALEFDYTGEYLVYDCFNRITNNSGSDLEYWDVNFIHVWDKAARDFGTGQVAKLFTSLPDGVSIGNPSFAKNSPNIIAFDFFNETQSYYSILGCNIETNDVNELITNNTLAWPSFNKDDSRIAFTSEGSGDYKIDYVSLNSDKISSNGGAKPLFTGAKWPVYFSTGSRDIGEEVTGIGEERQSIVSCYPNPFVNDITLRVSDGNAFIGNVQIKNLLGQSVAEYTIRTNDPETLSFRLDNLAPGQYIVKLNTGTKTGTCKITKR